MLSHYPLKSFNGFRGGSQALANGYIVRVVSLEAIPGGTSVRVRLPDGDAQPAPYGGAMPVRTWTTSAHNLEPFIGPVLP
jgi:hypothetical protein